MKKGWKTMQSTDAALLRRITKGEECKEHRFDAEYVLGSNTGDYVCTRCGKTISGQAYKKLQMSREGRD